MLYSSLVLTLPSATQETPAALLNDFLQPNGHIADEAPALRRCDRTPNPDAMCPFG